MPNSVPSAPSDACSPGDILSTPPTYHIYTYVITWRHSILPTWSLSPSPTFPAFSPMHACIACTLFWCRLLGRWIVLLPATFPSPGRWFLWWIPLCFTRGCWFPHIFLFILPFTLHALPERSSVHYLPTPFTFVRYTTCLQTILPPPTSPAYYPQCRPYLLPNLLPRVMPLYHYAPVRFVTILDAFHFFIYLYHIIVFVPLLPIQSSRCCSLVLHLEKTLPTVYSFTEEGSIYICRFERRGKYSYSVMSVYSMPILYSFVYSKWPMPLFPITVVHLFPLLLCL